MTAKRSFLATAGAMVIGVLCLASANVNGQVSIATEPRASTVIPETQPKTEEPLPAGATVIYSNFGTGSAAYNATMGWVEAGKQGAGFPVTQAMSFVPDSDYILIRIDAAFEFSSGTNGMKLLLAEDDGGVPGKAVYFTTFSSLPLVGTCCTVQTAKLSPTKSSFVGLKGGRTYWLFVLPADLTTYIAWNFDTTNLNGRGANSNDYGQTWDASEYSPLGAFDVYGIKTAQ